MGEGERQEGEKVNEEAREGEIKTDRHADRQTETARDIGIG